MLSECCRLSGLARGRSRREAEGRWGVEKKMCGKGQLESCRHSYIGLAAAPKACWLHLPGQQAQTPARNLFQGTTNRFAGLIDTFQDFAPAHSLEVARWGSTAHHGRVAD